MQLKINKLIRNNEGDMETLIQTIEMAKALGLDFSPAIYTAWPDKVLEDKSSSAESLHDIFNSISLPFARGRYNIQWTMKLLLHPSVDRELLEKIKNEDNWQDNKPPSVVALIRKWEKKLQ